MIKFVSIILFLVGMLALTTEYKNDKHNELVISTIGVFMSLSGCIFFYISLEIDRIINILENKNKTDEPNKNTH